MAKFGVKKGDKITARTPALVDENTFKKVGGHEVHEKPLTVTKAYDHGVSTKERGYVHNNNILSKVEQHESERTATDNGTSS